ncbi:helix-turn-helix domain-containing protein [Dactylosporangium sucinum]|uniref:Glycoside hydrolase family 42 N-terminal domain-containing protein n=1 Tax=Dactylosporangium sucinum TaxID=1424081 RepID=A0A917TPU1_9ACTN|nr:helix-turn-helix domain-containing protein [Dactylosporangium sucinum]GGM31091.1 hypothetical protein GCM10007977_035430 [Dactylosporangium sucinum]
MHHPHGGLAALLTALKDRSGYSYAWLGRKINASKSAVHRYIAGQAVPHDFGTVERLAKACGATPAELDRLYALWTAALRDPAVPTERTSSPPTPPRAAASPTADASGDLSDMSGSFAEAGAPGESTAPLPTSSASHSATDLSPDGDFSDMFGPADDGRSATGAGEGAADDLGSADGAPTAAAARGTGDGDLPRGWRRWSWRAYVAAGVVVVVLVTAVIAAVVVRSPGRRAAEATGDPQWISGPSWTLPPTRVASRFFGVTINTPTGHMPGFPIGALRLWDSETRWAQIQPAKGEFDWATLDRLVGGAEAAGLPVLFVAGGTPSWAAPDGKRSVYPENARSTPPDDLDDWDSFVRALTQRYRGRIEAYEIWAFANDARLYSGSVETLVDMTERASDIIRAADPLATVVCPGMGNLWSPEAQQVMRRFAKLGGYRHCDVAAVKLHQRAAEDPPETMLELTGNVDQIFHEAGINPPLWNTGTTYAIPLQGPLAEPKARNYAVRFFLVGLFARNVHLDRMYFYNWGGTKIPIVLQPDGGAPTAAGLAVAQLQKWLATAEIRACGHGPAAGLPVNAWQCEFTVDTPLGRRRAVIRWTHAGTATMPADTGATELLRLDGGSAPLRPGGELALTEEPVLIRFTA